MLKVKLQYIGHLMWRAASFEKTLMLGKIEDRRRWGQQRLRWLDDIINLMYTGWMDSRSWWWTGTPDFLWFMGLQRLRHDWVSELNWIKSMSFPIVMYGCDSWTLKNTERWRIDAFELWCWRRLFRVTWTARRSNQCILKEINSQCSLKGLMLRQNSNTLAS